MAWLVQEHLSWSLHLYVAASCIRTAPTLFSLQLKHCQLVCRSFKLEDDYHSFIFRQSVFGRLSHHLYCGTGLWKALHDSKIVDRFGRAGETNSILWPPVLHAFWREHNVTAYYLAAIVTTAHGMWYTVELFSSIDSNSKLQAERSSQYPFARVSV